MNIVTLLKQQHQRLIGIMDRLAQVSDTDSDQRDQLFQEFKDVFNLHDKIEDKIVYPALRKQPQLEKLILKGYQAHHMAEVGILELRMVPFNSESWAPKFWVVRDSILHHMTEEERDILPKAEQLISAAELDRLGNEANDYVKDKETA
jgi:hypothetical protein